MDHPVYLKPETIRAIMNSKFKSSKTKISLKTAKYLAVSFNLFVQEAILRAGKQCMSEGSQVVTSDMVKKIITQLLLDFGS